MGQIFYSCAYDLDTKTSCVYEADKFHANCYAQSGSVLSVHYLLRQKPYNVMWGGLYVALDDYVQEISRPQDLLGLSTYLKSQARDCHRCGTCAYGDWRRHDDGFV